MSDSIQVAIKVRPLIKREKDDNLQIQWSVKDNALVPVDPEKKRGEQTFHFDHIFGPEKTNDDVFETVVKPIVNAAVKGFNGTVFAYGQTSSGKTYTMLGNVDEPGVIPMAVRCTFDTISEIPEREFLLRVSYLEIYNEKVHDLLSRSGSLKLREDSHGLVQVLDCKEEIAGSPDIIMNIMKKGDKNRRIAETDMNDRSSRSHTIFRITIESRDKSSDSDGAIQVSQLNLVDLAGSERARQTNATGERFKEGTHINMSLSALALVIKQLSDSSDSTKYVNFRDSKLTRLLQASLGGNAMTAIICAVTPAAYEETQCTLLFASRAKSVKNKPTVNEVTSDAVLLKRYKKQLSKLTEELEKVKNVNRIAEVEEMESKLQEKEHKLQETDRMNQILEERIELLKKSIVSADSSTKVENNSRNFKSNRRRTWAGNSGMSSNARFSLGVQNLPPIQEMSPSPEPKINTKFVNMKRRQSIIQSVNLNDESFQTAFTDFELELIEAQKEREDCNTSNDNITRRTVKFQDDVEIHQFCNESENWSEISAPNNQILIETDDCLVEKLHKKNVELEKLKERVVELEKLVEMNKKPSTSVFENSTCLLAIEKSLDQASIHCQTDDVGKLIEDEKDIKIIEQLKVINEKTLENEKYKQLESILRKEIEQLDRRYNELKFNQPQVLPSLPLESSLSENMFNESKTGDTQQDLLKQDSATATADLKTKVTVKSEDVLVNESEIAAPALKDKLELESSSIFANLSYFDNMEVSQSSTHDDTSIFTEMDSSKNNSNMSVNINTSLASHVSQNKTVIEAIHESIENVNISQDIPSVSIKSQNISLTMEELEIENARLSYDLEKKIRETEEIQRVVREFKQTLEKLQMTICILTNENMDMSKQLTEVRENNSVVVSNFQKEIDIMSDRLSTITEEKMSLQSELALRSEQYENVRSTVPIITDDEIKLKFFEYQEQIKTLNNENIELSTNLMEKIEELEKIKESNIQLYDHDCTYKQRSEALTEKIDGLEKENIELSNDLTEQIEECDKLKETVNVMKEQLEIYASQKSSENKCGNDWEFLKEENTRLSSELIELRAKLTSLTRENANLTSNLSLDTSDEHNDVTDFSCSNILNAFSILESSSNEVNINESQNISSTNKKVKLLQEQVKHLTMLNKKLGDLKLTSCSRCAHLKELNESRRELKLEVKALNQKLVNLQKKFQQKCVDEHTLKLKANDDWNATLSIQDSTLDVTYDGVNVTVVEEKVKNLHSELEELKENHNKLANQYQEKCNELEELQYDNTLSSPSEKKEEKKSMIDSSSRKHSTRIQSLEKDFEKLNLDLQELKKVNANTSIALNKFMIERNETMQEIESLKLSNEELKKECNLAQTSALRQEEKVKLLEEELSTLYNQIEVANASKKEIQSQKLEIEVQLERLLKENVDRDNRVYEAEAQLKKELEECNARLRKCDKENNNLKNELQKLEDLVQQLKGKNATAYEEKLKEEIELAKSRIMKEIKSLDSLSEEEQTVLPKKSVSDIFVSFLNEILSKEHEIIKRLQDEFEQKFCKVEEEKQQSIDSEKRTNIWAKTLEIDLEKLQGDLTEQECENRRLQSEIQRLEENVKEVYHENQQLRSRISNLEIDLNSLHNELEIKSITNDERSSDVSIAQEKERQNKSRENEWEDRLIHEKENHEQVIQVLNSQLEQYKSMNEDLKNTVEGLDLEIEHLKNTVIIKADDLAGSLRKIEDLEKELEQMENVNKQLKSEDIEKEKRFEDMTGLLKIKCDLLTEYKTKVEMMKPEYESLRIQISEHKMAYEDCKEEINALKLENKKQLDILQDKLNDADIKFSGLNKQLVEFKNKNTDLGTAIVEFKHKCAELERENTSLQQKIRNSTSKMRVENEMQELQDENRTLKSHLEGSYNRIKDLQESKYQVQQELTEVQGKFELLELELETLKSSLECLKDKCKNVNLQELSEQYELLLHEKNNIVLEVEDKKMLIADKDQKLVEYGIEIDTLTKQKEELDNTLKNIKRENDLLKNQITNLLDNIEKLKSNKLSIDNDKDEAYQMLVVEKNEIFLQLQNCHQEITELMRKNKELDDEMEELVDHIHGQENEIAELQDRLITGSYGGQEKIDKMIDLENENEKVKIDLRMTELNCSKLQTEIVQLNSEKGQLLSRIDDLNDKIGVLELKNSSRCSSKNDSPITQNGRRRHRRSDLYNQNRNLELDNDTRDAIDTDSASATPTSSLSATIIDEECHTCAKLRNRIREMSLDLISRNNKITMLEVQLESENFPYQMKCNKLKEISLQDKTKNHELLLEVQQLRRALLKDSSIECQVCRQKQLKKTEQAIQVNIDNKISIAGMQTRSIADTIDRDRMVKMEKDRTFMKNLCRSRARTIKELEQRIKELEGLRIS